MLQCQSTVYSANALQDQKFHRWICRLSTFSIYCVDLRNCLLQLPTSVELLRISIPFSYFSYIYLLIIAFARCQPQLNCHGIKQFDFRADSISLKQIRTSLKIIVMNKAS